MVLSEEFVLKDGSRLRGRITGLNGDAFYVVTSMGDLRLPRSAISTIQFLDQRAPAPSAPEQAASDAGARTAASSSSAGPKPAPRTVSELAAELEGDLYTHPTGRFQLRIPYGWTLDESLTKSGEESVAAITSDDRALLVLVTAEDFSGTLDTYKSLAEIQYRNAFTGYERLSEAPFDVDGRRGVKLHWRAANPRSGNALISSLVAIIPHPGRMVRISCMAPAELFEGNAPAFDFILSSYASTPF